MASHRDPAVQQGPEGGCRVRMDPLGGQPGFAEADRYSCSGIRRTAQAPGPSRPRRGGYEAWSAPVAGARLGSRRRQLPGFSRRWLDDAPSVLRQPRTDAAIFRSLAGASRCTAERGDRTGAAERVVHGYESRLRNCRARRSNDRPDRYGHFREAACLIPTYRDRAPCRQEDAR